MIILRILFGVAFFFVSFILSLTFGTLMVKDKNNKFLVVSYAAIFNGIALSVFFTLWCVTKGII